MIKASIHGRAGRDPVERQTRNGNAMATIPLAVNCNKPGAEEEVIWVNVAGFSRVAEALMCHRKGDLIACMGELQRTRYTGKDGSEREGWQMTAESIVSARTARPGGGRKRQTSDGAGQEAVARGSASAGEQGDRPLDDQIPW